MNAKVSMDVCISANITFLFSGFTVVEKLTAVESDIQELWSNKMELQTSFCIHNQSTIALIQLNLYVAR